ncbi:MAG: RodZ domain-containing protein [Gammaproteobacteria bacterium]
MQPNIAFLLLDGVPLHQSHTPRIALCALGMAPDGAFHPLEIRPVAQEDEHTWLALLRGLRAQKVPSDPLLISCDGHPALLRAIRAAFPGSALQLSVPHRIATLSRTVDASWQTALLAEARRIFQAHDRDAAVARFLTWRNRWLDLGERPVHDLEADLPLCLAFYRFPANLRGSLRSVSAVKRAVRRSLPAAAMEGNGAFISVSAVSTPPTLEAGAVALAGHSPRAPDVAAQIDARDVRKVPRPRRPMPYEFWAVACLAAFLAYTGAAELPELLKPSLGVFSSPPTIEQWAAPSNEPVNSKNVAQGPTPVQPVPVQPTPVQPMPASTPLQPQAPAPPQPGRGVPLSRGVIVVISATGNSWIRVRTDGVKVFENVLRPGEVRRWSANRVLQIRSGNAGAVDITVNGRRLGVLGRVGQIASRAFTRSSPLP